MNKKHEIEKRQHEIVADAANPKNDPELS